MKRFLTAFLVAAVAVQLPAASPFVSISLIPPEVPSELAHSVSRMNRFLEQSRQKNRLPDLQYASDAVFLRRAYLTIVGRIPTLAETRAFLEDKGPNRHFQLIDLLLDSPEHADLIAMRFADMLRVKSEFPVNLWPNAVQAFHQKLRTDILNNRPYKDMVFEMLTASGSNFRIPYANFFRGRYLWILTVDYIYNVSLRRRVVLVIISVFIQNNEILNHLFHSFYIRNYGTVI